MPPPPHVSRTIARGVETDAIALGSTTTELALVDPGRRMRGVTASVVVLVGVASANGGNAVFHLVAARALGPTAYGDVAALLALIGLVAFPLAGVQFAMGQYVARFAATKAGEAIEAMYHRSLATGLALGAGLTVLLVAGSYPLKLFLGISSFSAVVLAALATAPAVLTPVVWGLAQGLERFVLFSAAQTAAPALRIVFVLPLLALGFGVAGTMGAVLAGTLVALLVPVWWLRRWLTHGRRFDWPVPPREAARFVLPVVLGILALTSLTTMDVVVAKVALGGDEAGLYGAASLVGRVILYLPAAIISVLLPKVSSRDATGRETRDILRASLVATGTLCAATAAVYALAPDFILRVAFGARYTGASDLLWMFGVAMTGFALVHVLLAYHIARKSAAVSWLLLAGAIAQLAAFAAFHDSPEQLVTIDIVAAFVLLAAAYRLPVLDEHSRASVSAA